MKRLLCIVSAMNAGGAETFLMKIYRHLDKSQYQLDFCVNVNEQSFYDDEIKKLGGRIYYIPAKSNNFRAYSTGLENLIKENQYENVLRITSNAFGFLDCRIAKKAGAKKCIVRSSNSADAEGFYARLFHYMGRLLYSKYVDVRLAPSDLAAQYTFGKEAYHGGKVHILRNGLDLDMYTFDESERIRERRSLGIKPDEILVGHIGRFMKQKNHSFLINVFSELHKQIPSSKMVLIGNGTLMDGIKKMVEKKSLEKDVIFAGVRGDVPNLMSALDVLLLPSFYEGMPNVVIEAQANGLPCIISDTITREADVTNLVKYNSINNTEIWVSDIISMSKTKRIDTKSVMKKSGYDINSVLQQFVEYCF